MIHWALGPSVVWYYFCTRSMEDHHIIKRTEITEENNNIICHVFGGKLERRKFFLIVCPGRESSLFPYRNKERAPAYLNLSISSSGLTSYRTAISQALPLAKHWENKPQLTETSFPLKGLNLNSNFTSS